MLNLISFTLSRKTTLVMHLPKLSQKGYRRITSPSPDILSTCLTNIKQLTRLSRALHDIHDIHVYKYSTVTCYYRKSFSHNYRSSPENMYLYMLRWSMHIQTVYICLHAMALQHHGPHMLCFFKGSFINRAYRYLQYTTP